MNASTTLAPPAPAAQADSEPPARRHTPRTALLLLAVALVVVATASIAIGAKPLSLPDVWRGLTDSGSSSYVVVHQLRLPRTVLGLLVGAALGLAGCVMQTLTRNPLADPGLLGINAGASAAVASSIYFFGATSLGGYIWFSLIGAFVVAVLVYAVGGGRSAGPGRLVLAGAALNATLYSYVNGLSLSDATTLDQLRFWTVGSLAGATDSTILLILPFLVVGAALALLLSRSLAALQLGDDSARALGASPSRVRLLSIVAVTLLCGAATAACGPIVFVGLLAPHVVRRFTGPDPRWQLPACMLFAPVLLLGADVIGRMIARPGEVQVGVLTAVIGGPCLVAVVRRSKGLRG